MWIDLSSYGVIRHVTGLLSFSLFSARWAIRVVFVPTKLFFPQPFLSFSTALCVLLTLVMDVVSGQDSFFFPPHRATMFPVRCTFHLFFTSSFFFFSLSTFPPPSHRYFGFLPLRRPDSRPDVHPVLNLNASYTSSSFFYPKR